MKQCEMRKCVLVSILVMLITSVTYGAIGGWMYWDGEGSDDLWTTDANWRRTDGAYPDNTPPNADCNVSLGYFSTYSPAYAQITEGMNITIYGFSIGNRGQGTLDMTGGTLNTHYINNTQSDTSATAVLNLYGGTINVTTSIGVARDGTGTINVEGGTINCNLVMFALNSTGVGTINLNGGELVVDYDTENPDQNNLQIRDGSKFVISDGVLRYNTGGLLTVADFEAFADAGKILADTSVDPLNEISIDTVGDYIVVTAVPEPATMLLLGLGGLVLRKRR
ncbi:PEP-CTERM motif protein [Limihaloglobus sulfuriphilus]|uniref:PEP-CTERM motif protein n=1 Tax=Limihaloglobus sulfuriphilus TaxID=1851148 RepID=A0A1Q2MCT8_9BACT|nr:PEP-CTERM sorting domain-containing protein [Limihaloglobus sulfuriphilus]AQQ70358.1 PEP-CTERM motif protein [Limihaloglobus sulfuriphilus]